MSTITGFIDCGECGGGHAPVSSKCPWKIEKDAAFVLDAAGAALGTSMIGRVLDQLDSREGHRYVSSPEQERAYLLSGNVLTIQPSRRRYASDGAQWVLRADLPKGVLLIETSGGFGLIKRLAVPGDQVERLNAKKEFKIGMAHVGYAYDFCVESKDRALAEQVYRDLLQRAHQLSNEFGFSLEGNRKETAGRER